MKCDANVERKLTRARTQLLLNQPFFGALCLRLKLAPEAVSTMATDGRRIVYDPAFVDSLKPAELEAVLAHEVLHCALGHHSRRGQRDPVVWNQAADFAVNPIIIANGFTLPAGALMDSRFSDLSAEEIYARLIDERSSESRPAPPQSPDAPEPATRTGDTQQGGQTPQGSGSVNPNSGHLPEAGDAAGGKPGGFEPGRFGEVLDATEDDGNAASQAEKSRQEHEWSIAADQALRSSRSCGHQPANIDRPLSESRQSKQDWRSILRDFVTARAPADYRWSPPNRRYLAAGWYLPSVERAGLGAIVVAVDTSGSIAQRELEQFAGEISAISEEARPEAIHVVYCDASVQGAQEFQAAEPVHLEPRGGGGTDFRPVFEWVAESCIDPVCLIYLTDLCCHSYPEPPDYPVLWVTNSRRTAVFGETLRISSE